MMKQKQILTLTISLMLLANVIQAQSDCVNEGREFYRNGDYLQAINLLQNCPTADDENPRNELLASSYYFSGDLKSSLTILQSYDDSLASAGILSLKAKVYFARNDFQNALFYYDLLLKSDSLKVNLIRQYAICSDKLNLSENAISYYRRALELNPSDMVTGIKLVEKYFILNELKTADSLSAMLVALDSMPELLRLRGDVLYKMKEYTDAYSCYEPLLRAGTSNPDLLRKAGICKFVSGETELAISMLSTAHLIQSDDEITCYYLALAYQSKPDYKKSELYFNAAISNGISQNISNYYQRLGDMFETSGNYAKALESFQTALQYKEAGDNQYSELHFQVGRVYEVYFEDYKSAIKYYEQFLKNYADTTNSKYESVKNRKSTLEKMVK